MMNPEGFYIVVEESDLRYHRHPDKMSAVKEAERLAQDYHGKVFIVFQPSNARVVINPLRKITFDPDARRFIEKIGESANEKETKCKDDYELPF